MSSQSEHYDNIADVYEQNYHDPWGRRYRRKFIDELLFEGIDLKGKKVLDAMCGSGQTEAFLTEKGALVTGLDVSKRQVEIFSSKWPQCSSICSSILDTGIGDNSFDCVVVAGALHHISAHIDEAVEEIHRVLKPGGYFCFFEPYSGSVFDLPRKLWYKCDGYFEKDEEVIDLNSLKNNFSGKFDFTSEKYRGGIAYLLVYNSLIFRIPRFMKRIYSPFLMALESLFSGIQGKRSSIFVICRWRKKELND